MAAVTLSQAVSETFVRRFQGLASGSTPSNPLRGGDQVSIADGLRTGAQTFATAVQALNATVSFVQIGESTLDRLGSLTDELIGITEEAARVGLGREQRARLDARYKEIGEEFRDLVDTTKYRGDSLLARDGLSTVLTNVGLSPETADGIRRAFDDFFLVAEDENLASEEIIGQRPAPIPASAYSATQNRITKQYESLFADDRFITNRPDAYLLRTDLRALREQIDTNIEVLRDVRKVVSDNLELARAAGFAFLDVGDQLTGAEEAREVARQLQREIRSNADTAVLAQAANLEALVVAALSLGND